MTTVYYAAMPSEDEGGISICTTEKSYWDANHFVDDGSGQYYEAISDAMQACGAPETCESVFEIDSVEALPGIVAAMAAKGFALVPDPAFAAFLGRA